MQQSENPEYIDVHEEQLYCVHHVPAGSARGMVLLAGPFPSERPYSYIPWIRWARFLAANGYSALRFDYRGAGESTGLFENVCFTAWFEDLMILGRQLKAKFPAAPLALHGLGLGALLSAFAFEQGLGDALLLWSPPASGREVLREALLRRLAADFVVNRNTPRKTFEDYVSDLQSGGVLNVEGYRWSKALWDDAAHFELPAFAEPKSNSDKSRPWKSVKLQQEHAPLVAGLGQWRAVNPSAVVRKIPLNPDLRPFFDENLDWLRSALKA